MRITIELTEAEARFATVLPQAAAAGAGMAGGHGATPAAQLTGEAIDGGAAPGGLLLALGGAGAGVSTTRGGGASAGSPEGLDAGRAPAWLTEMIRDLGRPHRG
jgi:hypothetical protein